MHPNFTGARLVPGIRTLRSMRVENLARFSFFIERMVKRINVGMVLDFGCGVGEGTAYLGNQLNASVIGIDLDREAVKTAAILYKGENVSFAIMNAQQTGLPDQHFDGIISVEVIEHIPDPLAYLRESARLLKAGGLMVITTPNRLISSPTPGTLWPEHIREYSPEELTELLREVYPKVELWGEMVPVYEKHPLRRIMHRLAPVVKPLLPRFLRVRALPALQTMIKAELLMTDVIFSQDNIRAMPTLVAVCSR